MNLLKSYDTLVKSCSHTTSEEAYFSRPHAHPHQAPLPLIPSESELSELLPPCALPCDSTTSAADIRGTSIALFSPIIIGCMPTQVPIAFPVVSIGFSGLIKRAHQAVWPVFEDDMWKPSERLMETIRHYASFPATGVSLRQMVQFGDRPSTGMCIHLVLLEYLEVFQLGRSQG